MAEIAVGHDDMVAEYALFYPADPLDGALRDQVAAICLQLYANGSQCLEGMAKEQEFALRIDPSALGARCQPGPADLQAPVFRADVQVARRADGSACLAF